MQFFSHTISFSKNVFLPISACLILSMSIHSQTNLPATSSSNAQAAVSKSSPSQVVVEFYKAMRELRFREALMLTNLRPAVENLTVQEVEDLRADFETMASQVPEKIETSNEQISGNSASVLIKDPSATSGQSNPSEIKLRRENDAWIILSGDAEAEAAAKKEGKDYFYKLHFDLRHSEVEATMQDIIKAQVAFSIQNNGTYADLPVFVDQGTVTANVLKPETYGYKFKLTLSPDKKKYTVNAEPTVYGKTGKLSFLLLGGDSKTGPHIMQDDKAGAALTAKN